MSNFQYTRSVEHEPVATRVNHQPASLLGITSSELGFLMMVAAIVGVVIVIGGCFGGLSFFSPLLGLLIGAGLVVFGAGRLRAVKRNRPDRYYMHRMWYFLAKHVPGVAGEIVMRSGPWSTGRDSK